VPLGTLTSFHVDACGLNASNLTMAICLHSFLQDRFKDSLNWLDPHEMDAGECCRAAASDNRSTLSF